MKVGFIVHDTCHCMFADDCEEWSWIKPGRYKLKKRNTCQHSKQTKLYSDLLHACKRKPLIGLDSENWRPGRQTHYLYCIREVRVHNINVCIIKRTFFPIKTDIIATTSDIDESTWRSHENKTQQRASLRFRLSFSFRSRTPTRTFMFHFYIHFKSRVLPPSVFFSDFRYTE